MLVWLSSVWALHWGCIVGLTSLTAALILVGNQQRIHNRERLRDKRFCEEFEAYARLDARMRNEDARSWAKRICRLVAKKSVFLRMAMLMQDAEGRLRVASSIGMDDVTIAALEAETDRILKETSLLKNGNAMARIGERSFAAALGKEAAAIGCGRAIVIPLRIQGQRVAGALAVCADRLLMTSQQKTIEELIAPLETLALKLGWAMEQETQTEQPLRKEKSSQAKLLAGDVVRELSTPLTAVVGFAELIAETTGETRVRSDAEMIMQEARRMQKTVRNLQNVGRDSGRLDEPVQMGTLIREIAMECEQKLADKGVHLEVQVSDDLPVVHGSAERLRQMLEQLLSNAAQSVTSSSEKEIQVSVNHDGQSLQMIVSDTGPGFPEPGQVFHALPGLSVAGSARAGLALCREIVREHEGEINAFNLHPYGAAVVVELPLGEQKQAVARVAREVA